MFIVSVVLASLNGAIMKQPDWNFGPDNYYLGTFYSLSTRDAGVCAASSRYGDFAAANPVLQLLRAGLMLTGTLCFIIGVAQMGFAEAIAILYIYPFVIIALSPIFLGERVPPVAWMCVGAGFAGVLLVMRPSSDITGAAGYWVFAAGFVLGCHLVLTRKLVRAKSPLITSTFSALVIALATSFAVPFYWQPITSHDVLMIVAMGVVSAASQYLMLLAFSRAPASILAPFSYSEIPAAAMIGLLAFGEAPDAIAWVGIVVIAIAGVVMARLSGRSAAVPRPRQPLP